MGGVAVCLHGYQRNTVDVDFLIRRDDSDAVKTALSGDDFAWHAREKEFRSVSGVAIQFLRAGDRAGTDSEVKLPDPSEARVYLLEAAPRVLTPFDPKLSEAARKTLADLGVDIRLGKSVTNVDAHGVNQIITSTHSHAQVLVATERLKFPAAEHKNGTN